MERNCITCRNLVWCDGDYCCVKRLRILCNAPDGKMTSDMKIAVKINRDCSCWEQGSETTVKTRSDLFNNLV